jgi:hypothetical protein
VGVPKCKLVAQWCILNLKYLSVIMQNNLPVSKTDSIGISSITATQS